MLVNLATRPLRHGPMRGPCCLQRRSRSLSSVFLIFKEMHFTEWLRMTPPLSPLSGSSCTYSKHWTCSKCVSFRWVTLRLFDVVCFYNFLEVSNWWTLQVGEVWIRFDNEVSKACRWGCGGPKNDLRVAGRWDHKTQGFWWTQMHTCYTHIYTYLYMLNVDENVTSY